VVDSVGGSCSFGGSSGAKETDAFKLHIADADSPPQKENGR
jgi:hypothetical protein